MQFGAFLKWKQISIRRASKELRANYETCRLWATGQRTPRPKRQLRIEEWSGGQVKPKDWFDQAVKDAA